MESHYKEWVERQAIDAEDYQLLIENEDTFKDSTSYRFFAFGKSVNAAVKEINKSFQKLYGFNKK